MTVIYFLLVAFFTLLVMDILIHLLNVKLGNEHNNELNSFNVHGQNIESIQCSWHHLGAQLLLVKAFQYLPCFLSISLQVENALAVWDLARCLHCEALAHTAKRFVLANFPEVCSEPDFLLVDAERLTELLADDDLRSPDEDLVCEAALAWLRHDLPARMKFLNEICLNLRLRYLSEESFTKLLGFVRNECHIKDSILEELAENRRYSFPPEASSSAVAAAIGETHLASRNYENMLVVIGYHRTTGILPTVHAYSFNTKVGNDQVFFSKT